MDVFLLLENPHHSSFHTNIQILQQLNFDFCSTIPSNNSRGKKIQADLGLHLSIDARQLMTNPKTARKEEFHRGITINTSDLHFAELMLIATNRLNQYNLDDYFNDD